MDRFGQGPDAFGLIHAEIGVGANVLYGGGEARVIDFDDCALGYWMFDVGVALSDLRGHEAFPQYRDAFRDGYAEVRRLPEEQWAHLDLFIATWHAFEMVWATAGIILHPASRQGGEQWVERAAKDLMRCLDLDSTARRS
jgi:Ser/Thr protein kinase RdoA (MazF antagonist)